MVVTCTWWIVAFCSVCSSALNIAQSVQSCVNMGSIKLSKLCFYNLVDYFANSITGSSKTSSVGLYYRTLCTDYVSCINS